MRVEGPGEEKNEDMYISEVNDRRMRGHDSGLARAKRRWRTSETRTIEEQSG